jgi:hypothetical protein
MKMAAPLLVLIALGSPYLCAMQRTSAGAGAALARKEPAPPNRRALGLSAAGQRIMGSRADRLVRGERSMDADLEDSRSRLPRSRFPAVGVALGPSTPQLFPLLPAAARARPRVLAPTAPLSSEKGWTAVLPPSPVASKAPRPTPPCA